MFATTAVSLISPWSIHRSRTNGERLVVDGILVLYLASHRFTTLFRTDVFSSLDFLPAVDGQAVSNLDQVAIH